MTIPIAITMAPLPAFLATVDSDHLPLYHLPGLLGEKAIKSNPTQECKALVEHISAQAGSFPSARRLRPYLSFSAPELLASGPPAQKVHLSILPRRPKVPLVGNCGAPKGQA